jgi:hypothetical protein
MPPGPTRLQRKTNEQTTAANLNFFIIALLLLIEKFGL